MKNIILLSLSVFFLPALSRADYVFDDVQVTNSALFRSSYITGLGTTPVANSADNYYDCGILIGQSNTCSADPNGGVAYGYYKNNYFFGGYNNVYNADNSLLLGINNSQALSTQCVAIGISQVATSSTQVSELGYQNYAINTTDSFLIGLGNRVGTDASSASSSGLFELGNNLIINSTNSAIRPGNMILLGFYNATLPLGATGSDASSALFVVGNGTNGAASNAIVTLKSGHTAISHLNYIQPTTSAPYPAGQPEVLVVEGSTTLKGDATIHGKVSMAQRQGDIWMGKFGRAEDQSPSN